MKKTARVASMIATVFAVIAFFWTGIFLIPSFGDRALAAEAGGCCMRRECPEDSCQWYVMPGDYDSCKKINDERDRDDVESESGLIWWSHNC